MIRFIRDLRLLPIALIASACLLALKTADLVLDGRGYLMMSGAAPPEDGDTALVRTMSHGPQGGDWQCSWAQQVLNFPGARARAAFPRAAPALIAAPARPPRRKAPTRCPTGVWLAPFQSEWNKIPLASEPAGC
jgi:hypothetical protein